MKITGKTRAVVDREARKVAILARLAELDKYLPRPLEVLVGQSPEALAEILDAQGTTRGSILAEKQGLRAELAQIEEV